MKILCVSDHIDPVVYSSNIKKRFGDIELILAAGDLPLSYYDFIVSSLNKPLLFIFGNHNLQYLNFFQTKSCSKTFSWEGENSKQFGGITYIGWKAKKVKDILFAGFGGSKRYNEGKNQYTEMGMKLRILRLLPRFIWNKIFHGRYIDIVLTHAPAKEICDDEDPCHSGFDAFLWLMRKLKPKYMIHGHVHLYDSNSDRMSKYYETTVVNAYKHVVIEI